MAGPYQSTRDGTTITNVPDDIDVETDEQLGRLLDEARAKGLKTLAWRDPPSAARPASAVPMAAAPASGPAPTGDEAMLAVAARQAPSPQGIPATPPPTAAQEFGKGFVEAIPGNIGAAVRGAVGGATAPVTMVLDPISNLVNLLLPANMKQLPPSQGLMALLTAAGVPEAETEAQKILQAATAGMAGGAAQVGVGQAMSALPGTAGAVGKMFAAGPAQQIAGGAGAGIGSEVAAQAGAGPGVQLAAGLAGGMAGSALGGLTAAPSRLSQAPLEEAAEAGVSVLPGNVKPPTSKKGRWLEQAVDELPFGPGPLKTKQAGEQVKAIQGLLDDYGAGDLADLVDDAAVDMASTRKATLHKWKKAKLEVIDKLSEPIVTMPDNPMDPGLPPKQVPVPMPHAEMTIDAALKDLNRLDMPELKPLAAKLEAWQTALKGKTLADIEDQRSIIFGAKKDPDLTKIKSKADKYIQDVYNAVKSDMGDYILERGEHGKTLISSWLS